jgi:hypothetical protein
MHTYNPFKILIVLILHMLHKQTLKNIDKSNFENLLCKNEIELFYPYKWTRWIFFLWIYFHMVKLAPIFSLFKKNL